MDKIRAAFNLTPVGQAANLVGSLIEASNGNEQAALNHYVENTPIGTTAQLTADSVSSVTHGVSGALSNPEHANAYLEPTVKDLFANGGTAIAGLAAGEAIGGPTVDSITDSIVDGANKSFQEFYQPTTEQEQNTPVNDFEFSA